MSSPDFPSYTAFAGDRLIARGALSDVALEARRARARHERPIILVFDDTSGEQVELDLRGTSAEVEARYGNPLSPIVESVASAPRPGRPRLGVVAREVTLLPVHWQWLSGQPGGASVTLRKLVEAARRVNAAKDRIRSAREAAYRFMTAISGNAPGFEEAIRALFAGNRARFEEFTESWPVDLRDHARRMASPSFDQPADG